MNALRERGWYLTEHGYDIISDYGNITDIQQLVKRACNIDFKEIGSGEGNVSEGNIVLQIQKIRNTSAPKNNEESRAAPRMLKLSLTDGKNNYQALEVENIPSLSLNTLPGSKILLGRNNLQISHGIILLRSHHISKFLGGHVSNLVEKWELNKKLALHSRVRSVEEGGPPPWIPFGQQIINIIDKSKNFKSLNDKATVAKENTEFEAQRNDAIAEAAKKANKKVFGGGNKQLLDHSVQKIMEQGFTMEQAEYALKMNRNNINKALKSLQKNDNKQTKETKEPKTRRFEKRNEESGKPSSGKVSLFDFLENKLPAQMETMTTNDSAGTRNQVNFETDRTQSDYQSNKGGRSQKGSNWNQSSKRANDESNRWSNYNSSDSSLYYNASNNAQQHKPPRFQSQNNEIHSFQQENALSRNFARTQGNNSYFTGTQGQIQNQGNKSGQPRLGSNRRGQEHQVHQKNLGLNVGSRSYRNQNQIQSQNQNQDQNYQSKFSFQEDSFAGRGTPLFGVQQSRESQYNRQENAIATGSWTWQKGDKCLAKYWEDNMYYNAEVFAVSNTTCVVQFKDFNNYEEVLQIDCIPITEENPQFNSLPSHNLKIPDYRVGNRNTRYNHSQQANVVNNRGDNGRGSGKNYKKRNQQRNAQPIYQPPAQRNVFTLEQPMDN